MYHPCRWVAVTQQHSVEHRPARLTTIAEEDKMAAATMKKPVVSKTFQSTFYSLLNVFYAAFVQCAEKSSSAKQRTVCRFSAFLNGSCRLAHDQTELHVEELTQELCSHSSRELVYTGVTVNRTHRRGLMSYEVCCNN